MKHFFLLTMAFLFSSFIYSQSCFQSNCISIYGAGPGYEQANLNTLFPNNAQAGVKDVEVFAWTATSAGVPNFNGRTAMKFNLSGIPAGATITSAKVYFTATPVNNIRTNQPTYTTNTNASLLQKITSSWTETAATWNTQPTVTTTGQKTQAKSTTDNQNYQVDIADFVQFWVNKPDSNFGMMYRIQTELPYNCLVFYGGNAATVSNRLRIDVCYTVAGSNSSLVLFGNKNSKMSSVVINNNYPNYGFSHYPEIMSMGWTNNAQGFPVFNNRTLIRYEISDIPPDATVNSAKLYLFAKQNPLNGNKTDPMYGSNNTSLLQKITQNWDTTGATTGWSNQPTINTSTQKVLAQSTSLSQDYVIDVTDFTQSWVNRPDSNFGMLLRLQTEATYNSMIFVGDATAANALQPRLEVCYSLKSTLPLSLINFNAGFTGKAVSLFWNTMNEQNAASTEIQFGTNGVNFTPVATVKAKNTAGNNAYTFNHELLSPVTGRLFYRLRLINADGSFTYSKVLVIYTGTSSNTSMASFPNPTKNYSSLSVKAKLNQVITLKITNIMGQVTTLQTANVISGNNTVLLKNSDKLGAGNYIISSVIDGVQQSVMLQKQ
jgi:hypothetical protein